MERLNTINVNFQNQLSSVITTNIGEMDNYVDGHIKCSTVHTKTGNDAGME